MTTVRRWLALTPSDVTSSLLTLVVVLAAAVVALSV